MDEACRHGCSILERKVLIFQFNDMSTTTSIPATLAYSQSSVLVKGKWTTECKDATATLQQHMECMHTSLLDVQRWLGSLL